MKWLWLLIGAAWGMEEGLLSMVEELDSVQVLLGQLQHRKAALLTKLNLPNDQLASFHSSVVPKFSTGSTQPLPIAFDLLRVPFPHSKRTQHESQRWRTLYYTATVTAGGNVRLFESSSVDSVLQFDLLTCELEASPVTMREMKAGVATQKPFLATLDSQNRMQIHGLNLGNRHRYFAKDEEKEEEGDLGYKLGVYSLDQVSTFALHHTSPKTVVVVFATLDGKLGVVDPASPDSSVRTLELHANAQVHLISILGSTAALAFTDGQVRFASLQPFKLLPSAAVCLINPLVLGQIRSLAWVEATAFANKNRFLIATTTFHDVLVLDRKFQGGWESVPRSATSSKILAHALGSTKKQALVCAPIKRLDHYPNSQVHGLPHNQFLHFSPNQSLQVWDLLEFAPQAETRSELPVRVGRASLVDEVLLMLLGENGAVTTQLVVTGAKPLQQEASSSWLGEFQPHKYVLPLLVVVAVGFQLLKRFGRTQPQHRPHSAASMRAFDELFHPKQKRRQSRGQALEDLLAADDEEDEDGEGEHASGGGEEEEEFSRPSSLRYDRPSVNAFRSTCDGRCGHPVLFITTGFAAQAAVRPGCGRGEVRPGLNSTYYLDHTTFSPFTQTNNCKMATLSAKIQDPDDVAKVVAAMGNPGCSREYAKQVVGEKGNRAVRDHIARALENCRVNDICIEFQYSNLDQASVQLLANAVEKNTCIGGFTCMDNPFNFPDGENYDPSTNEPVKRAIIASKAPITMWNDQPLPQDMVEARRQRAAAAEGSLLEMTQALTEFELNTETSKTCVLALQKYGFDSLKKLASVEESDLTEAGITGFNKRTVLKLKASLNTPQPIVRAAQPTAFADFAAGSMPPLPLGINYYAFMSHNWGEHNVNHKRVQEIVNAFRTKGWPMWFDDERLTEQVDVQITNGMDESVAFVVFITKAYVGKVASGADKDRTDWCYFEFNYASTTMLRKMIAVVMDEEMLDHTEWKGPVGARLGNALYIDYTSEDKFESACSELAKAIAGKIAPNSYPNKKSKLMYF
ncbi:hypothetical protein BASA81_007914 [Batrachochytrium salamandrivorans]|nr:hypothetical protein BASA81_007914 [Batrachochytrium salamandrivorans]